MCVNLHERETLRSNPERLMDCRILLLKQEAESVSIFIRFLTQFCQISVVSRNIQPLKGEGFPRRMT